MIKSQRDLVSCPWRRDIRFTIYALAKIPKQMNVAEACVNRISYI
jgi:hypothetical protein